MREISVLLALMAIWLTRHACYAVDLLVGQWRQRREAASEEREAIAEEIEALLREVQR